MRTSELLDILARTFKPQGLQGEEFWTALKELVARHKQAARPVDDCLNHGMIESPSQGCKL